MTPLQKNALAIVTHNEATVKAIFDAAPEGELGHRLRNLCLSHERLRMEAEGLRILLEEAEAETKRLRDIIDKPRVMLFADGREPTKNERHLVNLLEWRELESRRAKEDVANLRRQLQDSDERSRHDYEA